MFTAPYSPLAGIARLADIPGVPIVIADTETNGLKMPYLPGGRRAWEYCLLRRDPDGLVQRLHFFVDLSDLGYDLDDAEMIALMDQFGDFSKRHPQMNPQAPGRVVREADAAKLLYEFFHALPPGPEERRRAEKRGSEPQPRKPWLLGAVATFEEQQFLDLLRRHGHIIDGDGPWNYHVLCVEVFAAGRLRTPPPWDAKKLTRRFGVDPARFEAHTADGDVEWALALYEAALKPLWSRWAARVRLALKDLYNVLTAPRRRRAARP